MVTSIKKPHQVATLLALQTDFYAMLVMIKEIEDCSLAVDPNTCETYVKWRGQEVSETRRVRFNTPDELNDLLDLAGL